MYVAVLSVVMTSALRRPLWPAAGGRQFYVCHIEGGVSYCHKSYSFCNIVKVHKKIDCSN
jgi:hypothetical protein